MQPHNTTSSTFITLLPHAKDITGQRFGRLVALGPIGRTTGTRKYILWLCQCDCGNTHKVTANNLRSGSTASCGCWLSDRVTAQNKTHGMWNEPIYKIWTGIKDRCTNSAGSHYTRYGARGITICNEWQDSFESFYSHVSQLPHFGEKGYSIDRIDNDGDYEPGNVRWATGTTQSRNRRTNRLITFDGVSRTVAEWAETLDIGGDTLRYRLGAGWSVRDALFTRPHGKR